MVLIKKTTTKPTLYTDILNITENRIIYLFHKQKNQFQYLLVKQSTFWTVTLENLTFAILTAEIHSSLGNANTTKPSFYTDTCILKHN